MNVTNHIKDIIAIILNLKGSELSTGACCTDCNNESKQRPMVLPALYAGIITDNSIELIR